MRVRFPVKVVLLNAVARAFIPSTLAVEVIVPPPSANAGIIKVHCISESMVALVVPKDTISSLA